MRRCKSCNNSRRRSSQVYDEDFLTFNEQIKQLTNTYNQSTNEQHKLEIKEQLSKALSECKNHMGSDIRYSTSPEVNRRFVSFYMPRYRVLQKAFSSIQ